MTLIFCLLNGILWAFLRRWFGGGYKDTWLGNNRGVQCIFMIASAFLAVCSNFSSIYCVLLSVALAIYLYSQFWSRGHGPAFDMSRGKNPSKETIQRYGDVWWDKLIRNSMPEKYWYGFIYDFRWMSYRYMLPVFWLAIILHPSYILMGFGIVCAYAICWDISDRDSWLFSKFRYANGATQLAEYVSGFIFGFLLLYIRFDLAGKISIWQ